MKQCFLTIMACVLCLPAWISADNSLPNVAVLELSGTGIDSTDIVGLSNRLRNELHATGQFNVLERSRVNEILREQGFTQAACDDRTCAVEIGQLIGVEKIVLGNINRVGVTYATNIRLVDVNTGKIEKTANADCHQCSVDEVLVSTLPTLASRFGSDPRAETPKIQPQSAPWPPSALGTGAASLLIPGVGQFRNRQLKRGCAYLAVEATIILVRFLGPSKSTEFKRATEWGAIANHVISAVDAYRYRRILNSRDIRVSLGFKGQVSLAMTMDI